MKIKNKICVVQRRYFAALSMTAVIIFIFGFIPSAQAKEKDEPLHVYYSESIGAGDRVYHVTSCMKARSYAPQRCSASMGANAPKQCGAKKTVKNENGLDKEVLEKEGTPVKACINITADIPYMPDAPYPKVEGKDVDEYEKENHGFCGDKPENIVFNYVPEYAVVDEGADLAKNPQIYGTVAFEASYDSAQLQKLVDEVKKDGKHSMLYRTTLCKSWDILPEKTGEPAEALFDTAEAGTPPSDGSSTPLQDLIAKFNTNKTKITDETCDTDNSRQAVVGYEQSTPFNEEATYSCTIQWRISGSSGADIFGQYVSAIYKWVTSVVGIFAVLIITFSGVQISMAGGDSAVIDKAKNRIMQSLMGLAVLFLAALILYTINPSFFTG